MNREIKFRAWCDSQKRFVDPVYTIVNFSHIFKLVFYKYSQFTGLHDKNGKEIYEGDIIRTPKGVCAVTFELGCFYAITVSRYRLGGWRSDCIEVIGNIYENPELLNDNNTVNDTAGQ